MSACPSDGSAGRDLGSGTAVTAVLFVFFGLLPVDIEFELWRDFIRGDGGDKENKDKNYGHKKVEYLLRIRGNLPSPSSASPL